MYARIASAVVVSVMIAGMAQADTAQAKPAQAHHHPAQARLLVTALRQNGHLTDTRFDAADHVKQGYDLLRQGRQAQAVALFDKVIADADRKLAGDLRPRLCREAAAVSVDAVTVDPVLCQAHFGKGFALIDLGRGDLAEAELRQASQMAPGSAHFANEYAELFKSRRDWQQSYDLFAKAWAVVDKAPAGPDARLAARALRGMGFTKAAMGRFDEAETLYNQSLQFDAGSEIAHAELGNIARRKAIGS